MEIWQKAVMVVMTGGAPIAELRGAIPLGVTLGFTPFESFLLSILGNLLIVPPVLLLIEPLFTHFKKLDSLRDWVTRIEERTAGKMKHYREYRLLGLFILVAIPLPGTGAYTGCLAARILKIGFFNAWLAISGGVLAAGVVVYALTAGIVAWL